MKKVLLSILFYLCLSSLSADFDDIKNLVYRDDTTRLYNVNVFSQINKNRTFLNSHQMIEYIMEDEERTLILDINNAPKDSVGISWLITDEERLFFNPIYNSFHKESYFPSFLIPLIPPDYAGFNPIEEDQNTYKLESDKYTIIYGVSDNGFIESKTIVDKKTDRIIWQSTYSGYREIDKGKFLPINENRWSMLFPRVELELNLIDVRLDTLKEDYFTEEYVKEAVK